MTYSHIDPEPQTLIPKSETCRLLAKAAETVRSLQTLVALPAPNMMGVKVLAIFASVCSLVSAGPLNNLLADLTGQHHDGSSTCLADGHTHACSHASSFTGFFPDAAAPAHSDHFFPSISTETVSGSADAHQGDVAHLDQFDSSLLANRRPKMFVSFDKK